MIFHERFNNHGSRHADDDSSQDDNYWLVHESGLVMAPAVLSALISEFSSGEAI
jgi:hypothetical protein